MTQVEVETVVKEIMSKRENQAELSITLATLSENLNKEETESVGFKEKVTTLEGDNESLRKANMALFLKVGQALPDSNPPDTPPPVGEQEDLKFEDLFNEKGGLK